MAYEATPARAGAIAAARDSEAFRAALRVAHIHPRRGAPRGDLRRPLLRSCERRARTRERRQVRRSRAHARPGRAAAGAARSLGLRLVPADRGLRLRGQRPPGRVLPALPAAGAGGGHAVRGVFGRAAPGGLRRVARRVSRGPRPALPPHRAGAGAAPRASNAAPARRVPGGRVLRRALLGEPLPAAGGGRLLCGAHRELGVGRRMRRPRVRHSQRRAAAPDTAGDALVELAPAPAARRRMAAPRAARDRRVRGLARPRGGRCPALPRRAGRVVARAQGAAGRRLGRARGGGGRRASAGVGLAHARVLRAGRGRPVPDCGHQRDAVRDAGLRGGGVRGRVAPAPAGIRGVGRRRRSSFRSPFPSLPSR